LKSEENLVSAHVRFISTLRLALQVGTNVEERRRSLMRWSHVRFISSSTSFLKHGNLGRPEENLAGAHVRFIPTSRLTLRSSS
jgi:hypothetical protein